MTDYDSLHVAVSFAARLAALASAWGKSDVSSATACRVQVARFEGVCVEAKTAHSVLAGSAVHSSYSQRTSRTQEREDRGAAPE